ncbi:MAG: hypothetical protein JST89_19105 [Cyanobacteria bacterium SZAS-4]|nr:hypothetical protein [Cyanobacteria bacterium SZAS-4]
MVEQNKPAGDAVPSANASALTIEHERTLRALQSEINYHREHDEQGSYLGRATKFIYDSGAASLHGLELSYDAEREKPNSVSRESVIASVKDDQTRIKNQDSIEWMLGGATSLGLYLLGGRYGRTLGSAVMAANAMHPSDSISKQAFEGLVGAGQGLLADRVFNFAVKMRTSAFGYPLAYASYPFIGASVRGTFHNTESETPPDAEKIYGEPAQVQAPGKPAENGVLAPSTTNWRPPYNGVAPSAVPDDGALAPPTAVPRAPSDWYK